MANKVILEVENLTKYFFISYILSYKGKKKPCLGRVLLLCTVIIVMDFAKYVKRNCRGARNPRQLSDKRG